MITTALLLGLLLTAATTDLWRRKIYNWTTYPGILAALGLNALGSTLEATRDPDGKLHRLIGWVGLRDSLEGFLVCGVCMLFCYVFFRIGGGDVKLIAMLGAFLGLERGVEAMLWTFVLGGCVAVVLLIWRVGFVRLTVQSFRHVLATLRTRSWVPLSVEERSQLQPPLFIAPMALAAVLIVRFSLLDLL